MTSKHPPGPPMTLGNMRELRCIPVERHNASHTQAACRPQETSALRYSMTSSARASSCGGTSRLRALAVLRLISFFVAVKNEPIH